MLRPSCKAARPAHMEVVGKLCRALHSSAGFLPAQVRQCPCPSEEVQPRLSAAHILHRSTQTLHRSKETHLPSYQSNPPPGPLARCVPHVLVGSFDAIASCGALLGAFVQCFPGACYGASSNASFPRRPEAILSRHDRQARGLGWPFQLCLIMDLRLGAARVAQILPLSPGITPSSSYLRSCHNS